MTVPDALQGFVILAKSATGTATADIIRQATSANGVYSFTALLEAENIQRLAGTEYEPSLNLLRIFSWGTFQDYKSMNQYGGFLFADVDDSASLPPLNDAQLDKLRRLTLVTLASKSHVLQLNPQKID
jgi:COP9 signalosome complex subunit 7